MFSGVIQCGITLKLHFKCIFVINMILPKLKSFWSCSHMNCCLYYMLHINLHISYILFITLNSNLKEFQESKKYIKSCEENKIEFLDELYFELKLH